MIKHQDYIRLHMGPLADGIKKHAHQWMKLYGQKLQESASLSLVSLQELLVVSACINILVILYSLLISVISPVPTTSPGTVLRGGQGAAPPPVKSLVPVAPQVKLMTQA